MTEDILQIVPTIKLYKKRVIVICTFLTGPLVGGYMIAENFKSLGERSKSNITLVVTIVFTLFITLALFLFPAFEKIPNIVFPVFFASITSASVNFLQGSKIDEHIKNGGAFYKNERAFIVSVICLAIFVGMTIGLAYLIDLITGETAVTSEQ